MTDRLLYAMAQFDRDTSIRMQSVQDRLLQAGITGRQTPGIPYHITLGAFETEREQEIRRRLEQVCAGTARFDLEFNHIGLFGLKVLFFAPDANIPLLDLHRRITEGQQGARGWTPHTTILIDEPEVVQRALPIVAECFTHFHATVESVSLYEFWPTRFISEYALR
jgi:2'-5' RNA ligase